MERWKEETSRYRGRLTQLPERLPDLSYWRPRLPDIPLTYTPSPEGNTAVVLSMFACGCMGFTVEALTGFIELWTKGLFATVSLHARLIMELWGAIHYAQHTLQEMEYPERLATCLSRTARLTLGARSEVTLPWGSRADLESIHVMDFIRSLTEVHSDAKTTYGFLCESCHPSFLRLTTWSLTGPNLDNWSNQKFRQEAHGLLGRTLVAVEQCLDGIGLDIPTILNGALPYIDADRREDDSS